jgi:hypothetical protein
MSLSTASDYCLNIISQLVFLIEMKMDLQEVGGGCGTRWCWLGIGDSWRALVSTVRNLRVPKMQGIS